MHAGGQINGQPMTNTISTIDENYNRGKRYFEIDFSKTKDEHYFGLHDWDGYLMWFFKNIHIYVKCDIIRIRLIPYSYFNRLITVAAVNIACSIKPIFLY